MAILLFNGNFKIQDGNFFVLIFKIPNCLWNLGENKSCRVNKELPCKNFAVKIYVLVWPAIFLLNDFFIKHHFRHIRDVFWPFLSQLKNREELEGGLEKRKVKWGKEEKRKE